MHRICPRPSIWHDVYTALKAAAASPSDAATVPMPLILSGWAFSNDAEKQDRWQATVTWAKQRGLGHMVDLPDSAFHVVTDIYSGRIGPFGGPMFLDWNSEARARPSDGVLHDAFERLLVNWREIAGPELSAITTPLHFSGAKKRRLVVSADYSRKPPWGSWTQLAEDESARRSFTRLRAAINAAAAPHEVDHVSFIEAVIGRGIEDDDEDAMEPRK